MLTQHLKSIIKEHHIDFVIANGENSAHGFGLTSETSKDLFKAGVKLITGGNHSFDKKEIIPLMQTQPILRPLNFPPLTPGKGTYITTIKEEKLAVINLMGFHQMGIVENPFNMIQSEIATLKEIGIKNIFIDFHAETTSEKNTLLAMLKSKVSFIAGTHTHIGTDDLHIVDGTGYVSDVGLTGCRDSVIGMAADSPIYRFTTGLKKAHQIPKQCKKILQAVVCELQEGICIDSYKIKAYDTKAAVITQKAYHE
jgi:metallophosphoesterase (TIGR00282 family)